MTNKSAIKQASRAGRKPSLNAQHIEVLRAIDAFTRDLDPRVVQVSATISAGLQEVEILRPEGLHLRDVRPMARINISVIVEQAGRRESGGMGGGGRFGLRCRCSPARRRHGARRGGGLCAGARARVVSVGARHCRAICPSPSGRGAGHSGSGSAAAGARVIRNKSHQNATIGAFFVLALFSLLPS